MKSESEISVAEIGSDGKNAKNARKNRRARLLTSDDLVCALDGVGIQVLLSRLRLRHGCLLRPYSQMCMVIMVVEQGFFFGKRVFPRKCVSCTEMEMVFSKVVWFGSEGWDLMDGGGNGDGADKGDGKRNPSKRTLTGSRERREREQTRRGGGTPFRRAYVIITMHACMPCKHTWMMHACHASICCMHIKKKKIMVPLFLFFFVGMKNKVMIFLD